MQSFDPISTKATLRDSRALIVNNDRTIMSNSSGTKFPTVDTETGMFCYRTDQKKLYILEDKTNNQWDLVFDANKTAVDKEYVDQQISTRSASTHNHDSTYYTKALSDQRYYQKSEADDKFLGMNAKAADSGKFNGLSTSDFVRSNVETTMSAHLRFGDNKEIRIGSAADGRIFCDGTSLFLKNSTPGSSSILQLTKTSGSVVNCISLNGGALPSVSLSYDGQAKLDTVDAGVKVYGDLSTTTITASGQIYTSGHIVSASDKRLKTDIEVIEDALSRVNECRGVEFTMSGERYYGVIAQEIEKLFPHAVVEMGNDEKTKSVNYSSLVGVLIEAIKQLTEKVDVLERKVK